MSIYEIKRLSFILRDEPDVVRRMACHVALITCLGELEKELGKLGNQELPPEKEIPVTYICRNKLLLKRILKFLNGRIGQHAYLTPLIREIEAELVNLEPVSLAGESLPGVDNEVT